MTDYINIDMPGRQGGKEGNNAQSQDTASLLQLSRLLKNQPGVDMDRELDMPMCTTCSTQTTLLADCSINEQEALASHDTDKKCRVCLDPRQYIGPRGQQWTTLRRLITHSSPKLVNDFSEVLPGRLWTFKTRPAFGIGQRAFLIKSPEVEGLVMWDCVAYIDDATLAEIDVISKGKGIAHLVLSHPHYYSTTATWLAAFKDMTLWLSKEDFYDWYQRSDILAAVGPSSAARRHQSEAEAASRIRLIEDQETCITPSGDIKALLLGGHFPGSLVLLWQDAKSLFLADTIQVVPSALYKSQEPQRPGVASVAFLWSYPNQIPLSAAEVARVCAPLEKVSFDKAFGAFEGFDIWSHAKDKILDSRDIFLVRLSAR